MERSGCEEKFTITCRDEAGRIHCRSDKYMQVLKNRRDRIHRFVQLGAPLSSDRLNGTKLKWSLCWTGDCSDMD